LLSQDPLIRLKAKKEMQRQWKQGQVSWEEYSNTAQLCRDGVRKANVQMELNLARDANKKRRTSTGMSARKEKSKKAYCP